MAVATNAISQASKYAAALDRKFVQDSVIARFNDPALKATFGGAHTVYLPDIEMVGLGTYSKTSGFPVGKTTLTHTAYALSMDRGRELSIDAMDADESGVDNLAGQMAATYVHDVAAPEADAYGLSKLFSIADTASHTDEWVGTSPFSEIIGLMTAVGETAGYDAPLICFVDSTAYGALRASNEFARYINVAEFDNGKVKTKVQMLDNCIIQPVPTARMMGEYTFDAGATQTAGGFTPKSNTENVRAICLPLKSASLVVKHNPLYIYHPGQTAGVDAHIIDYRVYYDLFVRKSQLNNVHALYTDNTQ